jgi:murein DD-endopeptidase MepM/ murein hydrolase activator NlpD
MLRLLRTARKKRQRVQRLTLFVVALAYCIGVTWLSVRIAWYSTLGPAPAVDVRGDPDTAVATSGSEPSPSRPGSAPVFPRRGPSAAALDDLRTRRLLMPVRDVLPADLHQSFEEERRGHLHEAIDILAPRGTPVVAVEDGRIARLFLSQAGGLTIYQFDPTERFTYYYAHLEKYAPGLDEGDMVRRGDVVGYVGTSGNAPETTPHLHFAIFELGPEKRWWQGAPVDPFLVWR